MSQTQSNPLTTNENSQNLYIHPLQIQFPNSIQTPEEIQNNINAEFPPRPRPLGRETNITPGMNLNQEFYIENLSMISDNLEDSFMSE